MKSVLFIVTEIDSASGICVQAVAQECIHNGYTVHILTQVDSVASQQDRNFHIRWHYIHRHWSNYTITSKHTSDLLLQKILGILKRAQIVLLSFIWPVYAPSISRLFSKTAISIVEENNIDIVVPVYNTIDALMAGMAVKIRISHIRLIPYFLDSLCGGQKPTFISERSWKSKAKRWETRVMKTADSAVMMQAAYPWYKSMPETPQYFNKIKFLDLPLLLLKEDNDRIKRKKFFENETVFLFAGSMPRNIRSPLPFLEVFETLTNPDYRLCFIGSTEYEQEIKAVQARDSRIQLIGFVTHLEAIEYMKEANYLINLGNKLPYMVPSKIFEYMSACKPIISMQDMEDDPSAIYLQTYPRALILKATQCNNAEKMMAFITEQKCYRENETIRQVRELCQQGGNLYNNTPGAFVNYLEEVQ